MSEYLNKVETLWVEYPGGLCSTGQLRRLAQSEADFYIMTFCPSAQIEMPSESLSRIAEVLESQQSTSAYSDMLTEVGGIYELTPTIDYQPGSVRDDFDFGKVFVVKRDALLHALIDMKRDYRYAGLYDLRLHLSRRCRPLHIAEPLYVYHKLEAAADSHFAYVDKANREVQIEMEEAFTDYLKAEGCWLPERPQLADSDTDEEFPVEASVVIPVYNREATIADAVRSALSQTADFDYNVIVVDNHSTDGTTAKLQQIAADEPRLVHIIPESRTLGIGGCWSLAINDPRCGRYAVQLDSDDLYSSETTLQRIVDAFRQQRCAMVVGSYKLVDFELNEIPPGVIDHREWTDENGHNNLLRVNGIGAPRAFSTTIARRISIPNVSYGEDYAIALQISRKYLIGRIFDVLYLCRRWKGNSDASLSVEKANRYNHYKDSLRTFEVMARRNGTDC